MGIESLQPRVWFLSICLPWYSCHAAGLDVGNTGELNQGRSGETIALLLKIL